MYKRSQIEEALARVTRPGTTKLGPDLKGRVKRLLERDRALGRNKRSRDPEGTSFAFYSAESPGRGRDNSFTPYEAFALLIGLQLMGHGWPQGFVVSLLRRLRPELERHHARILKQESAGLCNAAKVAADAKAGDLAVGNTAPLFIVVVTESPGRQAKAIAVCRGQGELFALYHQYGPGFTFTSTEFVNLARVLAGALSQTVPSRRGRPGR
jgi:hypothetical protein